MSIDGCYLDNPYFTPGVTLVFPLDLSRDRPKFYLNPFGQLPMGGYILDSPAFFREVEIKYPFNLFTKDIEYAVLHIDEDEIDSLLEEEVNRIREEGGMWERELIEHYTLYAKLSKEFLSFIKQNFEVRPNVPVTTFRQIVRDTVPKVIHLEKITPKLSEPIDVHREWFEKLVGVTEKVHKRIAERYNLSYDSIVNDAWDHIKTHLERL